MVGVDVGVENRRRWMHGTGRMADGISEEREGDGVGVKDGGRRAARSERREARIQNFKKQFKKKRKGRKGRKN